MKKNLRFIDANVFLYANLDASSKGLAAAKLLEEVELGTQAITSSLVLDEIMWVVRKHNKALLHEILEDIYRFPNLTIVPVSAEAPLQAAKLMEKYNLKPRDAIHAATMHEHNTTVIVSDDSDFDRVKEIRRIRL
jgi:predicted nucleic acid-binding protein